MPFDSAANEIMPEQVSLAEYQQIVVDRYGQTQGVGFQGAPSDRGSAGGAPGAVDSEQLNEPDDGSQIMFALVLGLFVVAMGLVVAYRRRNSNV